MTLFLLFSCGNENMVKNEKIEWKEEVIKEEIQEEVNIWVISEERIEEEKVVEFKKETIYEPYSDWNIIINFWTWGYEVWKNWNINFWKIWPWYSSLERGYNLAISNRSDFKKNIELFIDNNSFNMWYKIEKVIFWDIYWYIISIDDAYWGLDRLYIFYLYINNKEYIIENNYVTNVCRSCVVDFLDLIKKDKLKFEIISFDNIYKDYRITIPNIYNYFNFILAWAQNNSEKLLEIAYNLKHKPTQTLKQFIETYKEIKDLKIEKIESIWENKYKTLVVIDWIIYESIFEIVEEYKLKTISVKKIK